MSFAARARSARAANDTTRAQINNIPEKSHVIPLFNDSCSEFIYDINDYNDSCGKMADVGI